MFRPFLCLLWGSACAFDPVSYFPLASIACILDGGCMWGWQLACLDCLDVADGFRGLTRSPSRRILYIYIYIPLHKTMAPNLLGHAGGGGGDGGRCSKLQWFWFMHCVLQYYLFFFVYIHIVLLYVRIHLYFVWNDVTQYWRPEATQRNSIRIVWPGNAHSIGIAFCMRWDFAHQKGQQTILFVHTRVTQQDVGSIIYPFYENVKSVPPSTVDCYIYCIVYSIEALLYAI